MILALTKPPLSNRLIIADSDKKVELPIKADLTFMSQLRGIKMKNGIVFCRAVSMISDCGEVHKMLGLISIVKS